MSTWGLVQQVGPGKPYGGAQSYQAGQNFADVRPASNVERAFQIPRSIVESMVVRGKRGGVVQKGARPSLRREPKAKHNQRGKVKRVVGRVGKSMLQSMNTKHDGKTVKYE